jgi:hypothetical protein
MKVALEDYQAGRVEWVEVERTWHEYEEVEMIGSAEIFGEHYPAARAVSKAVIDRHIREATDEQLRQLQPDGATNIKRRRAGGS